MKKDRIIDELKKEWKELGRDLCIRKCGERFLNRLEQKYKKKDLNDKNTC